jgi:AraC family transcriptional regulator, arabinose operon regulatory protein
MNKESGERRPEGFPGQRLVVVPPEIVTDACRRPVTRDLCVTHIGAYGSASGHYVERPAGSAQHILIACLAGAGRCRITGREWPLAPGDLLFLPPRMAHVYESAEDAPWTIFWIHFCGLRAGDHLANLGVDRERPLVAVDDPAVLVDAFEDTYRHVRHGFGEAAMTGLSTAFVRLLGLVKVGQRSAGWRSRGAENRLLTVLALMREDLARPWTLEQLAAEATLSIPHLTTLCRRQTGMPPLGLLIRLRLQRAMDLLQRGDHNVTEAARAVGYDDPFYFSRLFRKHIGVPPSSCMHGP